MSDVTITKAPKPRLCKLYKWPTTTRLPYGFFLREDPSIREGVWAHSIRRPSPAYLAGLKTRDKVLRNGFDWF